MDRAKLRRQYSYILTSEHHRSLRDFGRGAVSWPTLRVVNWPTLFFWGMKIGQQKT